MNHRLVPSALSLTALAVICGVAVPSQSGDVLVGTELASHPADVRNLLDTGPDHRFSRFDPFAASGPFAAADPFAAWRAGRLLDSRASRPARTLLSELRATPVEFRLRPVAPTPQKTKTPAKPAVKPKPRTESRAEVAVRTALAQRGKPYVWGATGPGSFDCSGLVQYAYARAGIRLPRVTWDQIRAGRRVPLSAVRAGDLVFYREASHVGMSIGGGRIVHAPRPGTRVRTADLHVMPVYAVVRPY
ncbi:C40 family peptidase [Streptomyces sp. NPDC056632]|uniref:C40 family peptidase n=1 Tax=Streptomyces sp. NPDC056632 TaxID=3345884 RepID=UPI0036CACF3B